MPIQEMRPGKLGQLLVVRLASFLVVCLFLHASENPRFPSEVKLVAPLFIANTEFTSVANTEFTSVLKIQNLSGDLVDLRVEFDSLEGKEIGHKLVHASPDSTVTLEVDGVEMARHRFSSLGSISLTAANVRAGDIAGRLAIARRADGKVSVEESFQVVGGDPSRALTAFVPIPMSVPVLAVHSLSAVPVGISVDWLDAEGRTYQSEMALPPRMTFLMNACISRRSEARTYEQILRGDGGGGKGALKIRINTADRQSNVAVWGFTGRVDVSTLTVAGIEFTEEITQTK